MIIETEATSKSGWSALSTRGGLQTSDFSLCFPRSWGKCVRLLAAAKQASGLGIITEVMDTADLEKIAEVADVIQIGARNIQNFAMLKKVAHKTNLFY